MTVMFYFSDVSLDSFFGYTPNNAINKRVSLYTGDIRCLEIDAIVNAGTLIQLPSVRHS